MYVVNLFMYKTIRIVGMVNISCLYQTSTRFEALKYSKRFESNVVLWAGLHNTIDLILL